MKAFSYPKGLRWRRTPPPYDRVLERPLGCGLSKLFNHSEFNASGQHVGQAVLRKHDCPNVQVAAPKAAAPNTPSFSPCGERATLPFVSKLVLTRRILKTSSRP